MKDLAERIAALSPEHRALFIKQLEAMGVEIPQLPLEEEGVIPRRGHDGPSPLSIDQERLWFFNQMEPNNPTYNVYSATRLKGPLNIEALQNSLNQIITRHEAWRTTFHLINGEAVQVVSQNTTFAFEIIDVRDVPLEHREEIAQRKKFEATQKPFDLANGPIVRSALVRVDDEDAIFVLTIHHIVMDRVSFSIFFKELMLYYTAHLRGETVELPELPIHYADYAEWQRKWLQGPEVAAKLDYWKKQLADSTFVLELPTDYPRRTQQRYKGAREFFRLSPELFAGIKELARKEGSTGNMLFLTAMKVLLYRYSGQNDIIVGVPVGNRNRPETEEILGYFLTTSALRTDVRGEDSFRELMKKVRDVSLGAYQNQDLPFGLLLDELKPERDPGRNPVFQACFVYVDVPEDPFGLPGIEVFEEALDGETAKFDMTLGVIENDGGSGLLEYNVDLFKPETIRRMVQHYLALLEGIVANPDMPIGQLPMLTAEERQQTLVKWNDTRVADPFTQPVHQLFEAQVERTPDAVAVVFEKESLTYRELNARANQVAHHLQALGVGPEKMVGLLVERSLEMFVGLLGILKAGGAYVPLDPTFPAERLAYMLEDTELSVLLTQQHLLDKLPEQAANVRVFCLDRDAAAIAEQSVENPVSGASLENAVYVLYTSGSTGQPKGVVIEHRNLLNYVTGILQVVDLPAGSSFGFASTLAADIGITAIYPSLITGGVLHVLSQERVADPSLMGEYLRQHPLDLFKMVPSHLAALLSAGVPDVLPRRYLVLGGEPLRWELVQQLEALAPDCTIINHYGPSETICGVLTYTVKKGEGDRTTASVPLGRPIANTEIYLLDRNGQPVPVGVHGEVYIGGPSVTRGYLKRPELTAERFVPHPFRTAGPGSENARLYKTGDVARYLPDGNLEFQGRIDFQVKIRGFRVELGEIEAQLMHLPSVREALVMARQDVPGETRLVAYLVLQEGQELSSTEIRAHLQTKMPEYMIPTAFVVLEAFPLTANGKTDRRRLPAPDKTRSERDTAYVAPRDAEEEALVQIWEELLDVQPIGVLDNFFSIGGHSLLAMRLMGRVQEQFGQQLQLTVLFQGGTIEHLAKIIRGESVATKSRSLVKVQPEGTRRPLFIVHSIGGSVLHYYPLMRLLGNDQPFYCLQAVGMEDDHPPIRNVHDMAAHYIEEIRTIQPHGPYLLGGWSFGGVVSYEMARQLQQQGEEVALLAMLDTRSPVPEDEGASEATYALEQIESLSLYHGVEKPDVPEHILQLELDTAMQLIYKIGQQANLWPGNMDYTRFRRVIGVLRANKLAFHTYEPGRYSGPMTMFRSTEGQDGPDFNETHGWEAFVDQPIDVHFVPGNHFTVVQPPQVHVMAEHLQQDLDKVEARLAAQMQR